MPALRPQARAAEAPASLVRGRRDAAVGMRTRGAATSRTMLNGSDPLYYFVSAHWFLMAPVMIAAFCGMALSAGHMPSLLSSALLASGAGLSAAGRFFSAFERRFDRVSWQRYPALGIAIGLPMLLFGLAVSRFTWRVAGVDWDMAVAVFGVTALVATALLNGRLTSIVLATVSLWAGAAFYGASSASRVLLVLGTVVGLYIAVRQQRQVYEEAKLRAERERDQRRAEDLLSEYELSGQGWFWETDRRGCIAYVSPRIAEIVGEIPDSLIGKPFTALFRLEEAEQESERTLAFHLSTRSSFSELSVQAATRDGGERWWAISGRPLLDQFDNYLGFRGSGIDLTDKKLSQRHVTELARFDSLTKLANRFQMSEWLTKILAAPREENRACAVFLLDLDRFKQVNDTMGHPAGDALLRQVADRLRTTVGNAGRVGRLGGDEFQIILPGGLARDSLGYLAGCVIDNLSAAYEIDGNRVTIGASLGIAMCPADGQTPDELIRNADLALYAAKDRGRGRYHFYAEDLHLDARERQEMEQDLRDAIAGGGLELHYQPQVRTTTERITGFEALLRWKHPRLGYISPARFVPIAEDAGLIGPIGEWALRTACHDLARWPEEVRVAVNVSPLQFANPALPALVTSAIAEAGVSAARLELEITESVFLGDDAGTEAMFAALKGVGVRLALDDFGTGYSSLGYLKKAPFDKIKIDQSFVRGATIENSRNGAIIASIVSLAEALGMETTAEGVETLDELDLVRLLGCSHIQGYIYEMPLSAADASARLIDGLNAIAQGPRSSRAPRQTMLRKVVLEHGAHRYAGTIRNISQSGAMVEGLWNVPPGTEFGVELSNGYVVRATARWSKEDRMGVEFATPLELDGTGTVSITPPRTRREGQVVSPPLRKAG